MAAGGLPGEPLADADKPDTEPDLPTVAAGSNRDSGWLAVGLVREIISMEPDKYPAKLRWVHAYLTPNTT